MKNNVNQREFNGKESRANKYFSMLMVAIIIIGIGYSAGYRVGKFGIGKLGSVEIVIPIQNTDVFVDQESKISTTADNKTVKIPLTPTEHQIIISAKGDYPWTKKFVTSSGVSKVLSPLLIPVNVHGLIITQKDPEYISLINKIKNSKLPNKTSDASLWVENNIIYTKDATDISNQVIAPEPAIKNVAFYKNRTDAVLFSAGDSVFVIETEANSDHVQNIFPIYKGTDPYFIETDPNSIYVLDGTTLMQVAI